MGALVIGIGIVIAAIGSVMSAFGIAIYQSTYGNALLTVGGFGLVGGFIIVALGLVLRALISISRKMDGLADVSIAYMPDDEGEALIPPLAPRAKPAPLDVPAAPVAVPPPVAAAPIAPPPAAPASTLPPPPRREPARVHESPRTVEPPRVVEPQRMPEPPRRVEPPRDAEAIRPGEDDVAPLPAPEPEPAAQLPAWFRRPREEAVAAPAPLLPPIVPPRRPAPPPIFAAPVSEPEPEPTPSYEPAESFEAAVARAVSEPEPEPEPVVPERQPEPAGTVLKSGIIGGMAYTLYADGSIEAELPDGVLRFRSLYELREHVNASQKREPEDDAV